MAAQQFCDTEMDYFRLMEEAYMETSFKAIEDCTFGSAFSPCDRDMCRALMRAHKMWLEGKAVNVQAAGNEQLAKIAAAIDAAKKQHQWKLVFIRLSSRSPKDSALAGPAVERIVTREMARLEHDEVSDLKDASSPFNRLIHCMYLAGTQALACETGEQATQLLVSSKRIQGDLQRQLDAKLRVDPFNLVVREFRFFDVELELRGFVYGRRLTALTQYNDLVLLPNILRLSASIGRKIATDCERIVAKLPNSLENCVLDFVLVPKDRGPGSFRVGPHATEADVADKLVTYVVEINPLAEFAGSGLFSWVKDKKEMLGLVEDTHPRFARSFEHKGRKIAFRVQSKTPSRGYVRANLAGDWRECVDKLFEKLQRKTSAAAEAKQE